MIGSSEERRIVAGQLGELLAEMEWLRDRAKQARQLSRGEQEEATARMNSLKDRLESEYKRTSSIRGDRSLNAAEAAFYQPTVHKIHVAFTIRRGSKPSPGWLDALYDVQSELTYVMDQIERSTNAGTDDEFN